MPEVKLNAAAIIHSILQLRTSNNVPGLYDGFCIYILTGSSEVLNRGIQIVLYGIAGVPEGLLDSRLLLVKEVHLIKLKKSFGDCLGEINRIILP